MKTSVIRYRVADFLKQHPPFNEISEEDLLTLAACGRVIFHESEEYVFRKNQPCGPAIFVIQQGSVEILDESAQGEQLRDLLGVGDILGAERLTANRFYRTSARTTSDVILYSIDAEQFAKVTSGNTQVARYLAAQFPVIEGEDESGAPGDTTSWLDAMSTPVNDSLESLIARPSATVQEVAAKMSAAHSDWVAVVEKHNRPLGFITTQDLRDHMAKGLPPDTSVKAILNSHVPTSPPDLTAGEYFLQMMKVRSLNLAITAGGTRQSALDGVVTDSGLALSSGNNPALLFMRMLAASTVEDWKRLLKQQQRLLMSALTAPVKFDLCAQLATEFQQALVESVLRRAELESSAAGLPVPPLPYCWLLFGRAGRGESVVPFHPEIGVVYLDGPESADAKIYYSAILEKAAAYFTECGLRIPTGQAATNRTSLCQSLSQWKKFFQSRIADPIGNSVHRGRALFDFRPLLGDRNLVQELHEAIAAAFEPRGSFIAVMANDTLSNLPPLTFFQGLVVELDGAQRDTLDIESTALDPITDAARVFTLASGNLEVINTLSRLEKATVTFPEHAVVFNQAAQAFRIAAYQYTVASFRDSGDGPLIRPSILGRYDQRLLKTAFDAIQRLLECSSGTFDIAV